MKLYRAFRLKKYGEVAEEDNLSDDFKVEYPSPIKLQQESLDRQLEVLERKVMNIFNSPGKQDKLNADILELTEEEDEDDQTVLIKK